LISRREKDKELEKIKKRGGGIMGSRIDSYCCIIVMALMYGKALSYMTLKKLNVV
jgi:hypothetical protein